MSETTNGQIVAKPESPPATGPENSGENPEQANAVQTAAEARQPSKLESAFAITKSLIIRALIIYFITSFFRRPTPQTTPTNTQVATSAARNIFPNGTHLALHIYLSESENPKFDDSHLFWHKEKLIYGDWSSGSNKDGSYVYEKNLLITDHMLNNGSLYLHAYITRFAESPDPKAKNYAREGKMSYARKPLNRYKTLKASGTKNLLTGVTENTVLEDGKVVSHWHPNLTINLVTDQTYWTWGAVPQPLNEYIDFMENGKLYKPILYINDFWNMAKDYKPLNESFSLQITFQPLSLFKWQLFAAQSMRQKYFNIFGDQEAEVNDDEQDALKETLLDTNPYLLGLTIIVSIVHSVFELLAFKNDIQFWNNRNSLEGLSVKSVFFGVFQSLIVLLYVLDNDTNTIVRISCFIGLGIELWKIRKVVDIKFKDGRLTFEDKSSYVQSLTKDYDNLAFKYLSWVCFPLLAGYSGYALFYLEHKGWYSFVLDILYGYLLTFGFIMMTPQLFINYKLKSVAHLPWRMLTYKFLNTFIDDMFAFVIKMPTMYRIGCFRDDIIFLIFLYQRWIYPVDKSRRNEYGYSENDTKEAAGANNAIEDKKTQ